MADPVAFELSNKEKIATSMAENILFRIEKKNWEQLTRKEYLQTVANCIRPLRGVDPN